MPARTSRSPSAPHQPLTERTWSTTEGTGGVPGTASARGERGRRGAGRPAVGHDGHGRLRSVHGTRLSRAARDLNFIDRSSPFSVDCRGGGQSRYPTVGALRDVAKGLRSGSARD